MLTVEQLTTFLGWASVINIGILTLSMVMLMLMRNWAIKVHSKMFVMSEEDISKAYFQYLAQYKIVTLVFNIAPYFALKIMF